MPTPVGVGIPQAHFNLHEAPFNIFSSGEKSTQGGILASTFKQKPFRTLRKFFKFRKRLPLQLLRPVGVRVLSLTQTGHTGEAARSHTNLDCLSLSASSLFLQGGESTARDPTPAEHQGRRWKCTVGRVCHVSLRAGDGSPLLRAYRRDALHCPRHKRVRYTRDLQQPARVSTRTTTRHDTVTHRKLIHSFIHSFIHMPTQGHSASVYTGTYTHVT